MGSLRRRLEAAPDLVYRRWRVMLVTAVLVLVAGGIGLRLATPVYSARAMLSFEPAATVEPMTVPDEPAQLQDEIARVRSEAVLRATALALGLTGGEGFGAIAYETQLAELRRALTITRYGETFLIAIEARAAKAEEAARIANTLAQTFIETQARWLGSSRLTGEAMLPARLVDAGLGVDAPAEAVQNGAGTSRIATPAGIPQTAVFPNLQIAALIVLAALLAAFVSAACVEWLRDSFGDEDEMGSVLEVRHVACVPEQKPRGLPDGETQLTPADHLVVAPLSPYAEAIRRLRTGIERALARTGSRRQAQGEGAVVMVTSPASGDGKTTLALALTRAYAQAGQTVLLIDCDLRAPNLHTLLGREPSTSLADYLRGLPGPAGMQEIIVTDEESGAHVVMGQPGHDQPAEQLLAGPVFSRLVAAARRHFDVVVLDAPAIADAADAADGLHVAMLADLAVLALRSGSTGRKPAIAAIRALRDFLPAGAEIVAVLNRHTRWRHKAPHRSGHGAPPTVRALESQ
jgi:Mrp family chromosome partitioning ATPase